MLFRSIQDCGRFAELLGECIGAARARAEGRPPPNPDSALRRNSATTGPIATVSDVPTGSTSPVVVEHGLNITSKLVIAGLGLAFVIIVGAMLFGTNKSGDAPTKDSPGMTAKPDEGTKPPPVDSSALPKNRASIVSNVDKARVHLDGEFKCETPCTLEVPVGDGQDHEIILRKDGYIEVMTKWQPRSVTERPPQLPDLKPAAAEIEM